MRGSGLSRWQINLLAAGIALAALAASAVVGGRLGGGSALFLFFAVVGGLLLLRWPGLGLPVVAALSVSLPLTLGTGSEVRLTAPVFLIPAVTSVWLLHGLRDRAVRLPASRTVLPLLLLVGSALLSLVAGNSYWDPRVPRPANMTLVQLAQWAMLALSAVIYVVAGELGRHGRWLEWATHAFLGVAGLAVASWLLPIHALAPVWSFAESANTSMFWTWLAALATGHLAFNGGLPWVAKAALVLLLAGAAYVVWVFQGDWLSGWVPFTVAAASVLWLRVWKRNRVLGLIAGLALAAVAIALYPWVYDYVGGEREMSISWEGRSILYRTVIDLVKEHPLLGLGPASYRHYGFMRWLSGGVGRALWLRPAVSSHNNYIDMYAQYGLVGLGLFLWFLGSVARLGWRLAPRVRGGFEEAYVHAALGGMAGSLVAMMLVDWFLPFVYNVGFRGFRTSAVAWLFLGGLVALDQRVKEQGAESAADTGGMGAIR